MKRDEAYNVLGVQPGSGMRHIVERYKYLGKQHHPQHTGDNAEALTTFSRLSIAFATLRGSGKQAARMSLEQMLRQFQEVFFQRNLDAADEPIGSSSDEAEEDDIDNEEDNEDDDTESNARDDDGTSETTETIDHGSVDIPLDDITEEERERKRAEKRRLKKKRQKERKKLEKKNPKNQPQVQAPPRAQTPEVEKKKPEARNSDPSSGEDGDFDTTAAFFTEVKKKKSKQQTEVLKKEKKEKTIAVPRPVEVDETEPRVLRSRQLAVRGNEMAQVGEFSAAIELFTEAINLDPRDFRFFGNRSFCYDRVGVFDKALKDAEKAIELNRSWAKGYFRQGRALTGLQHYVDAEKSFLEVLKLDPQCSDAIHELFAVQVCQLTDMGFSRQLSETAIQTHDSVQGALEYLLSSGAGDIHLGNGNDSDEEEFQVQYSKHTQQKLQAASDLKMNPANPEGLTALWVGNVLPQVSEKKLMTMFQKYGKVSSVRMLQDKYCAFINFENKEAASRAMQGLQGVECEGQHLLIKFPDNPITANGHITLRKPAPTKQGPVDGLKKRGPVNGDECYFWRTTGCTFGSACRYKHIPEHKEIDKKTWQKS